MKVESTETRTVVISGAKNLDPITVFLQDFCPGHGRITIQCYDQVWTAYWGGMGDRTIKEFFCSCNEHYLSKNLSRITADIPDWDAFKKQSRKEISKRLVSKEISKATAASLLEALQDQEFNDDESRSVAMYDLLCDIYGSSDWYRNIPTQPDNEYQYLCRIIRAVQEGLGMVI